jgi:PadR family transcriptional regulator PadR
MLIANMSSPRADVLQGTLDLLILKTLDVLGAQHGFGIARRIEQVSADVLALNQGTLYPALLRLEQQGLIDSEWGTSTNNRRARFYSLTRKGRTRLTAEIALWHRVSGAVNNIVTDTGEVAV